MKHVDLTALHTQPDPSIPRIVVLVHNYHVIEVRLKPTAVQVITSYALGKCSEVSLQEIPYQDIPEDKPYIYVNPGDDCTLDKDEHIDIKLEFEGVVIDFWKGDEVQATTYEYYWEMDESPESDPRSITE